MMSSQSSPPPPNLTASAPSAVEISSLTAKDGATEEGLPQTANLVNPDPTRCCYYLERKRRFCKTERIPLTTPLTTTLADSAADNVHADAPQQAPQQLDQQHDPQRSYASLYCHMHAQELASGYGRATRSRKGLLAEGLTAAAAVAVSGGGEAVASSSSLPTDAASGANTSGSSNNNSTKGNRIPCPINPNHSIYEKDLHKHVKVCPDLRHDASKLPYFCKDLHLNNRRTKRIVVASDSQGDGGGNAAAAGAVSKRNSNQVEAAAAAAAAAAEEKANPPTSSSLTTAPVTMTAHKRLSPEHLATLQERIRTFYATFVAPKVDDCTTLWGDEEEDECVAEREKEGDAVSGGVEKKSKETIAAEKNAEIAKLQHQFEAIKASFLPLFHTLSTTGKATFSDTLPSSSSSSSLYSSVAQLLSQLIAIRRRIRRLQVNPQRLASKKHGEQHDQLCALIEASGMLTQGGGGGVVYSSATSSSATASDEAHSSRLSSSSSPILPPSEESSSPLWCVELGAGKAGLGQALHQFATECNEDAGHICFSPSSSLSSSSSPLSSSPLSSSQWLPANLAGFIVADYGSFRHKADGKSKGNTVATEGGGPVDDGTLPLSPPPPPPPIPFRRARINVKDLELFECIDSFAPRNGDTTNSNAAGDSNGAHDSAAIGEKRCREETEGETSLSKGEERSEKTGRNGDDFFVIGKHLCGACTDFSVSSCFYGRGGGGGKKEEEEECDSNIKDDASSSPFASYAIVPRKCHGVAIATCCHHRCELQHFNFCEANTTSKSHSITNTDDCVLSSPSPSSPSFFSFSDEEANAIISMTSWAVSGAKAVSDEQQRLGWICKRLIDYHRLVFIEAMLRREGRLYTEEGNTEEEDEAKEVDDTAKPKLSARRRGSAVRRLTSGEAWLAGCGIKSTPANCEDTKQSSVKFRVRLVQYVSQSVTPENVALVMEPVLTNY